MLSYNYTVDKAPYSGNIPCIYDLSNNLIGYAPKNVRECILNKQILFGDPVAVALDDKGLPKSKEDLITEVYPITYNVVRPGRVMFYGEGGWHGSVIVVKTTKRFIWYRSYDSSKKMGTGVIRRDTIKEYYKTHSLNGHDHDWNGGNWSGGHSDLGTIQEIGSI